MGGRTGMSIDERLPMKEEVERRNVRVIAEELETFLRNRPTATWDFAAPPALHNAVIEALSPETRGRMRKALAKDLSNQSSEEVRAHFETAGK
jgi:Protein required for attachment to host cells.